MALVTRYLGLFMHMTDALLSPTVGVSMMLASASIIAYSSIKVKRNLDNTIVPLMGALGSFVFAAQMINIAIPGTGASGHLGGGLLLAILLGPHASFITLASILLVQALFFADGGLLALGCNIFNLGFFPCFIAYPLIYKKLNNNSITKKRVILSSVIAGIIGLQLGAFGIVLQTSASGITELPFLTFILFIQPIHLIIGIIEGLITAGIVIYIWRAKPEIIEKKIGIEKKNHIPVKNVLISLLVGSLLIGAFLSWFSSEHPDGLEWSISKVLDGKVQTIVDTKLHSALSEVQNTVTIMPSYNFKYGDTKRESVIRSIKNSGSGQIEKSVAGLVGGLLTLFVTIIIGIILKRIHTTA